MKTKPLSALSQLQSKAQHLLVFIALTCSTLIFAQTNIHSLPDTKDWSLELPARTAAEIDKAELWEKGSKLAREENYKDAIPAWESAAQQGDPVSQYILGGIYMEGLHGVKKDVKKAISYYEKSGSSVSQNGYVVMSQENLGQLYQYGKVVPRNDQLAAQWFLKAVERDSSSASLGLAELAEKEAKSLKSSPEKQQEIYQKALSYYEKSGKASRPSSVALYRLGEIYEKGELGQTPDIEKAFRFYYKSASIPFGMGQTKIASFYTSGIEGKLDVDLVEAYKWYLVARWGMPIANKEAQELRARLSPQQIEEAQRRFDVWMSKNP